MNRSGSRSSAKGRWRTARGSSSPTGATPSRQGLLAAVVFSRIRRISSSDDGEEAAPRRLKRRNTAAMSASASATSEDFLSDASSAVSSPIRVPYIPPVVTGVGDSLINVDENILDSYMRRDAKYIEKTHYGNVPYRGPNSFERNHYMFISSEPNECAPGGPVIDVSGQFLGMINLPNLAFTPSAIILKCLHMLKKFDCIPRLNIGMKFSPIKFLDPIHQEKIIRKCDVNTGLIVTEVSEGSVAEKAGVRNGDIFKCLCGESICTTIELESILLRMAEEHLENGGRIGSTVDVPVGIFYVRQNSFRTVILSLKVSADIEVIKEGEYAITHEHYATMSDSNDDEDPGEGKPL